MRKSILQQKWVIKEKLVCIKEKWEVGDEGKVGEQQNKK